MDNKSKLPFGKKNYVIMLVGVGLLVLGFTVMSLDNELFGFGFMGLTLGPVIVMSGFIAQLFAILHNPKK